MRRDLWLLVLWVGILLALAGSAVAATRLPPVRCGFIGGQWIAEQSVCLCNGMPNEL